MEFHLLPSHLFFHQQLRMPFVKASEALPFTASSLRRHTDNVRTSIMASGLFSGNTMVINLLQSKKSPTTEKQGVEEFRLAPLCSFNVLASQGVDFIECLRFSGINFHMLSALLCVGSRSFPEIHVFYLLMDSSHVLLPSPRETSLWSSFSD